MFELNLNDKVVLITGGSDGLGFASAKLLSEQGAKIVICGRRGDYLKEKANIIREKTKNEVLDVKCDVSNPEECKFLVEKTVSEFKNIDVLVNNAGASAAFGFEEIPEQMINTSLSCVNKRPDFLQNKHVPELLDKLL